MTRWGWLIRRFVPFLLIVTAGGIAAGLVRAVGLFLPGLLGMFAGGILGWLTGKIGRSDPEEFHGFHLRAGLALGAGMLYAALGALIVSVLHAPPGDAPLGWLSGVLAGYRGEPFFGVSRYSLHVVGGDLAGGWWVFFCLVDALLFAFLFLVSNGAGASPDEEDEGNEAKGSGLDGVEAWDGPAPPPIPGASRAPSGPHGLLAFALFAAAAVASLVIPQQIWSFRFGPATGPALNGAAMALRGQWVFGPEASFLGPGEDERTFFLAAGPRGDLAGRASGAGDFLLSLEPRRDGCFTGRLVLPGVTVLDLRMRPSEGNDLLHFVFVRPSTPRPVEIQTTARRTGTGNEAGHGHPPESRGAPTRSSSPN